MHKTKEEGGGAVRVKTIYISDTDEAYWNELQKEAQEKNRSISFMVNILIREYIKDRKGRQSNDSEEGGAQKRLYVCGQ